MGAQVGAQSMAATGIRAARGPLGPGLTLLILSTNVLILLCEQCCARSQDPCGWTPD